MSYIDNCEKYHKQIVDAFEPARCVENFFSADEIDQLRLLQFQLADRLKYTSTSNNIQPVCDIDTVFERLPWLADRMRTEIGDFSDHHTGNYYITTQLHDAHVDLLSRQETDRPEFEWSNRVIPYKSVVIPLIISERADAYTAFFHQRHIGYSFTFDRVNISEQENSDYTIIRTYPDFYNIDGKISNKGEYVREKNFLFPQIPPGNLIGLSIEDALPYEVGNIMIFDACQIHASTVKRNKPNYRWLKSGMNIQFYKEI